MDAEQGKLYIVATPIGNLEDVTIRMLRVLGEVDLILCEDTRVTKKLLSRYDIKTKLERFDAVVEGGKINTVLEWLDDGKQIALVSDSGTPGVSDPGARLVQATRQKGFEIVAIPGPSAVTAALSISGVSADRFTFLGFPPHKKGRETFFKNLVEKKETVVFFESTHRILKTLTSLSEIIGERTVVLASELTKVHEEVLTGSAGELYKQLVQEPKKQKGEFVVVLTPLERK